MKIATFLILFLIVNAFSVYAEDEAISFDEPVAVTETKPKPDKWSFGPIMGEIGLGLLGAAGGALLLGALNNTDEGNIYGSAAGTALGSSLGVIAAGEIWGKPTKNETTTYLVTAGVSFIFPAAVALIYDANRTPGTPSCDDEVTMILLVGGFGGIIINPIINMITYNLLKDE